MKSYLKLGVLFLLTIFLFVLNGCTATGRYKPANKTDHLEVSFADSLWDGKNIPEGQQCLCFGGENPMTPRLKVNNIPLKTSVIVMEYSDRSYPPMDNGGHGIIGFKIDPGTRSVIIPSVPGHSFDLPEGFIIISPHKGSFWCMAGAYQPPCSGGYNNSYYVTIKAVSQSSDNKGGTKLLGKAVLELGIY